MPIGNLTETCTDLIHQRNQASDLYMRAQDLNDAARDAYRVDPSLFNAARRFLTDLLRGALNRYSSEAADRWYKTCEE